jgi:hypothetical protein
MKFPIGLRKAMTSHGVLCRIAKAKFSGVGDDGEIREMAEF